jgi:hypothetical protein
MIDTDYIGSCKYNCHTIKTTTAPIANVHTHNLRNVISNINHINSMLPQS